MVPILPAEWLTECSISLHQGNSPRLSCNMEEGDSWGKQIRLRRWLALMDGWHIWSFQATCNNQWASASRKANILLIIYVRAGGIFLARSFNGRRSALAVPFPVFLGIRCHRGRPTGEINTTPRSWICPFRQGQTQNRNGALSWEHLQLCVLCDKYVITRSSENKSDKQQPVCVITRRQYCMTARGTSQQQIKCEELLLIIHSLRGNWSRTCNHIYSAVPVCVCVCVCVCVQWFIQTSNPMPVILYIYDLGPYGGISLDPFPNLQISHVHFYAK